MDAIVNGAQTKILTRVGKAADHVQKANRLENVDEEMAVIRYIAAEEELVVAIFQWLILNGEHVGAHQDFLRKFKNHVVKLAFPLVLQQLGFVVTEFLEDGITLEGLEDHLTWRVKPTLADGRVVLQLSESEKVLLSLNPLDLALTQTGRTPEEAVEAMVRDLTGNIRTNWDLSLKEFVTVRADFRNKLLYADDGMTYSMNESLAELRPMFEQDLRRLLWALGCILTNRPSAKSWGLVNQFLTLYRRVLVEAKVLRVTGEPEE